MGDKVKIYLSELNGVEDVENTEISLTADLIELSPPVGGYDDVDAWIRGLVTSSSTDHHAGWHDIISGQTVEISERKQMRIKGTLQNAGILVNRGILVID